MLPISWFRRQLPEAENTPEQTGHRRSLSSMVPRMGGSGTNLFDAAYGDRLNSQWVGTPSEPDSEVERVQKPLVARSRERATNDDYVVRFLTMCRNNIVGHQGVILQAQPRLADGSIDRVDSDAIEAAWKDWGRRGNCEVTGKLSWRALQEACITSVAMDGEFFVRIVRGADGGKYGLCLQMLDAQRCPVDYHVDKLGAGGFVRNGIEFNDYGKPAAYFFVSVDESEQLYRYGSRSLIRIPASEIVHGFRAMFTNQKRGLPWTASALYRLRQLGEFDRAAVVNARISASKGGFFEWEEGYGPDVDDDADVEMEVEAGTWRELPPGVRAKSFDPQFPAGEHAMFTKGQLRAIAAGLGVSYASLANDLSDVNFSSARQGALDERENWKVLQTWFVESLCEPVFKLWLERSLLAGLIRRPRNGARLPATDIDKYMDVVWQSRRWQWVDPRSDVDANIKAKNNLLSSPSDIIRETGRDPGQVWAQVAADIASMKAAGIPEEFIKAAINDQMGKQYTEGGGSNGDREQ